MLTALWSFLAKPENRATLGWLGGGAVVVIGGLWAALGPDSAPAPDAADKPTVQTGSGISIGGDVTGSTIVNEQ